MDVDFIFFDLGGVLVDVDHARAEEAWVSAGSADCSLVSALVHSGAKTAGDRGEITEDGMCARVSEFCGIPLTREALRTFWGGVVSWRAFVPDLLQRLRVPYGVLSNIDPVHAFVLGSLPGACPVLYSFDLGVVKPHRDAFDQAVQRCGVEATRIGYLDDRLENVEGAQRAGMQARHVTDWNGIQKALDGLLFSASNRT
jgi:FMN phosphatase YigB (HAD superfamily)